MKWIKSGIENRSKSEVIGCCGGDEKPNDHAEPTLKNKIKFYLAIKPVGPD